MIEQNIDQGGSEGWLPIRKRVRLRASRNIALLPASSQNTSNVDASYSGVKLPLRVKQHGFESAAQIQSARTKLSSDLKDSLSGAPNLPKRFEAFVPLVPADIQETDEHDAVMTPRSLLSKGKERDTGFESFGQRFGCLRGRVTPCS